MDPNHGKPVSETPSFSIKASLDGTTHSFASLP